MKKFVLLLSLLFTIGFTNGQGLIPANPPDPAPDLSLFGAPIAGASIYGFNAGVMGGLNLKDIVMVGGFTQFDHSGTNVSGLYLQSNINPKMYWFHIGFSVKAGLVNGKYLTVEPALIAQNTLSNHIKLGHAIGIAGGAPSYQMSLIFGNFGKNWWKNPLIARYKKEYKEEIRVYQDKR